MSMSMPSFIDPIHLQSYATSSYLSTQPISTPQPPFCWPSMPPHQDPNAAQGRRKKMQSPPIKKEEPISTELCFITGGTPDELRNKKNMTIVRKKAMDSFLKTSDKKNNRKTSTSMSLAEPSSRLNSVALDRSRSSDASTQVGPSTAKRAPSPREALKARKNSNGSSSPESQVARPEKTGASVLPPAPIVLAMRTNCILPYDTHVAPPLTSIGKSLDPFRTMFQASNPHVSVEQLKWLCSRYFGSRGLGMYWIPTVLKYPHTFLSTLCMASAHHDVVQELPIESLATTALRQEIMHMVGGNILNPGQSIADHNIVAVLQLVLGEVISREESSLIYHEAGIETMVAKRGGLSQLGMQGRLADAISWVSLASAILRETKPAGIYVDYCTAHSKKNYPLTATIPESPVYCPHGKYVTLPRSTNCKKPDALELLGDIRMMIDIFLHETKQSRRNSQTLLNLYKKIIGEYPAIAILKQKAPLTASDWKYEAIRITAIIQATAIIRRIPFSEALEHVTDPKNPSSLFTSSLAAQSTDSLVSPFDLRYATPSTEYSTSPSYSTYSTSPAIQQGPFATAGPRSSFSSGHSSMDMQRPSISSTHSNSSEHLFFPPPPQPAPTGSSNLLKTLKSAIENSNISQCWEDMAGVLVWVGLVMGAACRKNENKLLKKYFSATAIRASVVLCFEHPEAIHSTMLRMTEVVESLSPESTQLTTREVEGKRRRT